MPDENRPLNLECRKHLRQHDQRFIAHEADRSRSIQTIRVAVSPPAVHQTPTAGLAAKRLRKVAPQTD